MPGVPDAPKIESSKDAGSPHTRVVCGLPRTPDGEDLQVRQAWRVSCLGLLALMVLLVLRLRLPGTLLTSSRTKVLRYPAPLAVFEGMQHTTLEVALGQAELL